jgi:hypothetical protein
LSLALSGKVLLLARQFFHGNVNVFALDGLKVEGWCHQMKLERTTRCKLLYIRVLYSLWGQKIQLVAYSNKENHQLKSTPRGGNSPTGYFTHRS